MILENFLKIKKLHSLTISQTLSETATIQNRSELSEETTNIPQSITITDGSNIV